MANTEFEESLQAIASRPYRRLISERIRGQPPEALADAVRSASDRMPQRLQPMVQPYLEAAGDKFLRSRLFWEASTCREALANILDLAAEVIDDEVVWECHKHPFAGDGELARALFDLSTAVFCQAAAGSIEQQRLMGIKRGWLR